MQGYQIEAGSSSTPQEESMRIDVPLMGSTYMGTFGPRSVLSLSSRVPNSPRVQASMIGSQPGRGRGCVA